ncbi:MAG: sigma 54-interacting transcriptional regulator [Pirellulaceae bacterium]
MKLAKPAPQYSGPAKSPTAPTGEGPCYREFSRVGDLRKYKPAMCESSCPTNRDLIQEVEDGTFREDLFFRLAVIKVKLLPPLRTRKSDIPELVDVLLKEINRDFRAHKRISGQIDFRCRKTVAHV